MSKLSPFVEGALSMLVMMPPVTYASPKFIDVPKPNITKVDAVTPSEPWVRVGSSMREIAKKQIQSLDDAQKQELEALLNEQR